MTLVVNLFGGPGTGKSTTAAGLFSQLKIEGVNAEIVHEFTKDPTWEERHKALSYQPYIMGKQSYHVHRLIGKVDAIITDSPILLSAVYKGPGYTDYLYRHLLSEFNSWNTCNFFLQRDSKAHRYNPAGRNQTEKQAEEVDRKIRILLDNSHIDYQLEPIMEKGSHIPVLCEKVIDRLY